MDQIYILNSVFIVPVMKILQLITCGMINAECAENCLDAIYVKLFGMNTMDILGFHRLRTITQLSFESIP